MSDKRLGLDLRIIEGRMASVVDKHIAAMETELRPLIRRYNQYHAAVVSPALRRAVQIGATNVDRCGRLKTGDSR